MTLILKKFAHPWFMSLKQCGESPVSQKLVAITNVAQAFSPSQLSLAKLTIVAQI